MVKGIASKVLIVLGAILVLAATLWWAFGLSYVLKVPSGVDETLYFEGEITMYVNPATYQPLPPEQEIVQPYKATRHIESLDDEYDSSTAGIKETVEANILGLDPVSNVYVIDRKNQKNIEDERAYAWEEDIKVNRADSYVLFPFNVSKEETYPLWKNECNRAFDATFLGEEEKEGLNLLNFGVSFEEAPIWDAFIAYMEMPAEVTLDQLKTQLSSMGLDMDSLMPLAASVLTPEDLQALMQALQQPIPLNYYYSQDLEVSVEPETGTFIDLYRNVEGISMEPDYSRLAGVFSLLMKYQQDPVLGPALQQLATMQAQIAEAAPQKIMEYSYQQTPESVSEIASKAGDGKKHIELVKLWLPLIILIAGVLMLATGILISWKVRGI